MKKKTSERIQSLRKQLFSWYRKNKRDYPWRRTGTPFTLLIAEMMLHRTRAEQVKPVFEKIIREYPSPEKLASARADSIADILYSLGLSWRQKNIVQMANDVCEKYSGKTPGSFEQLLEITGVGPYIAGAVASQAFGEKVPAVDSNVARVLTRYFGIPVRGEQRRNPIILDYARVYSDCTSPGDANMAIVDFASLVCTSHNPKCPQCPVNEGCSYAKLSGALDEKSVLR